MCQQGRRDRHSIARVAELFPVLGERFSQRAGTLSGGEQQMLALARAFVTDPTLVIADELSMGLAPLVVDQLFKSLSALREAGASVLVVEQYIHRALELADWAYVLNSGVMTFDGSPKELSAGDVYKKYLGTSE
jgi:branched-chain amino acid transport system ATP-binding protein